MKPDELTNVVGEHLQDAVKKSFDKNQADEALLSRDMDWMDPMIDDPYWRRLLYTLADAHQCQFTKFVISVTPIPSLHHRHPAPHQSLAYTQAVAERGHKDEIAASTTAVSSELNVFREVLETEMMQLISLGGAASGDKLENFKRMCTQSQMAYMLTQSILYVAAERSEGRGKVQLQRLSLELEKHAIQERGEVVRQISFLLQDMRQHPVVLSSITFMLKAVPPATNPADMHKLHKTYSSGAPPPVRFLQREDVLEIFVHGLYNPKKYPPNPKHREKYVYILAYAVSVPQAESGPPDKSHVAATIRAVDKSSAMCNRNHIACSEESDELVSLTREHRVVGMGVLHWIESHLTDPGFFDQAKHRALMAGYFMLLNTIAEAHPLQWGQVLDLVMRCIDIDPAQQSKETTLQSFTSIWRQKLLGILVFLLKAGCVIPVVERISQWAVLADTALTRHFAVEVLRQVEGPYSAQFCEAVLLILGRAGEIGAGDEALVQAFYKECKARKADLGKGALAALKRGRSSRDVTAARET